MFGQVVDDGVRLAVAVEVGQLGAAAHRHVVDAQAPLPAAAGVEDGALVGGDTGHARRRLRPERRGETRTCIRAPVSSLSLSSCLNSTVTALSQSSPASSTSVVLLMKKEPRKSVARIPGGGGVRAAGERGREGGFLLGAEAHLCWSAPS